MEFPITSELALNLVEGINPCTDTLLSIKNACPIMAAQETGNLTLDLQALSEKNAGRFNCSEDGGETGGIELDFDCSAVCNDTWMGDANAAN